MKNNYKFKVNDYAKSMFYLEEINDIWIKKCSKYLKYIFGKKIKNSVIVDYAFGRGNWSLAFKKLGAKEIIAIDKSIHNVNKFKKYLKKNKITNINVIEGDILKTKIKSKVDIFWVYGIFHHIKNINKLIFNIKKFWNNKSSVGLIYTYDKYSLRELIVEFCRKNLKYSNYDQFKKNSYQFNHFARLRVRDDMVVDYIKWYSKIELYNVLKQKKLYGYKFIKTFDQFCKVKNFEFNPHQLLITKNKNKTVKIKKEKLSYNLLIIKNLLNLISKKIKNKLILSQISVGLLNTHFNGNYSDIIKNLSRILLFLFYIIKVNKLKGSNKIDRNILNLLDDINLNKKLNYNKKKIVRSSSLLRYIIKKKIRL
tara:strand:+ start:8473 stop:9573 length:1101 start_codon:yes stop_codon:yes gene_type:complete